MNDFNTGEDYTVVTGSTGTDEIYDSAADDSLIGGGGGDSLYSSYGADTLLGGLGADRIYVANNSNVAVIDGGDGTDTLDLYETSDLSSTTLSNIEALHFQSGSTTFAKAQISGKNYTITSAGSPANLIVAGTTCNDTVDLGALDLSGFEKTLTVNASDGDDLILAGANMSDEVRTTAINGGDGDDTLTMFSSGSQYALDAVTSVEHVLIGDATATSITLSGTLTDSESTATIDASAMTGSNTLTFDASGGGDDAYHIIGGDAEDTLSGGVGDTLTGAGGNDTLEGNDGDDSLMGGAGDDSLVGGDDEDYLRGGTGVDTLEGGAGDDYLTGDNTLSDGGDFMYGGVGADTIKGSSGDDYIEGGDGDDEIYGEGITGNDGNDTIHGGDGNDTIYGEGGLTTTGNDLIFGDAGNDVIDGNAGNDTIDGGEGADTLSGSSGTDVLSYANDTTGVSVDLDSGVGLYGQAQGDDLTGGGFEALIGGSGNDTLAGTSGDESISGGVGNDEIHGEGGADTLEGGLGNDLFHFSGAMGSGGSVDGGDGTDTIYMSLASEDFTGATSVSGIEKLTFAHAGADSEATFNVDDLDSWTLSVDASASAHTQTLNIQGDTLSAANETFNLAALAFSTNWDTTSDIVGVDAGDGNDLIIASPSLSDLNGGAGSDTVDYSNSTSGVSVNLELGEGQSGWAHNDTLTSIEGVIGSNYGDMLYGASGADNSLSGGTGNDSFVMSSFMFEQDTLAGGDGTDSLEFTFVENDQSLANVTGVEHITLGDAATSLTGHDNLADYLSTLTVDGSALTGANSLNWNGNFIANIYQNIIGSDQGDSIRGGTRGDTLLGGSGEDSLEGGKGDDSIDGGANDQELRELDVAIYAHEDSAITVDLSASPGSQVSGGGGNDTLVNIEGVWGTAYDDSLTGDSGWANIFIDGGGNDTIDGNSAHDTLTDTGLDIVAYYESSTGIHAEMTGTDGYVTVGGNVDELHDIDIVWGSTLGDSLIGGAGDQEFMPDGGSDTVDGGAGDDDSAAYWNLTAPITVGWDSGNSRWNVNGSVDGDTFTDIVSNVEWIEGSQGNDTFIGNDDDNSFSGWMGADSINGGGGSFNWATYGDDPSSGVDTLDGHLRGIDAALDQSQVIDGWGNIDTLAYIQCIEGSAYDDTISGTGGSNYLEGGDGDDWIDGFGGIDTLDGEGGDDTISVLDTFSAGTVIRGGEGTDELQADVGLTGVTEITGIEKLTVTTGATVGLDGSAADGQTWEVNATDSGSGTSINVVATYAGQGIDISGWTYGQWNSGNNVSITGYSSSGIGEAIVGGLAAELIVGRMGNDSLTGGGGQDTFAYSSASEVLSQGTGGDVIADFVSGTDSVAFNTLFGDLVWYEEDNYDGIIAGGSGNALIWDSANHRLWYDENVSANDAGTQGVVGTFTGATVAMSDVGVDGHTVTAGSAGGSGQSLTGTAGNDTLSGTIYNDTIYGLDGDDVINGLAGDDTLVGGFGSDSIYGNDGADEIWGDDSLNGSSDVGDFIDGGLGHDMLIGAYGNDTIQGGGGNDTLWGGDGDDSMSGGAGADEFMYMYGSAINLSGDTETITDLDVYDYIWLTGDVGSNPYTWITTGSFTGADGSSDARALVNDTVSGSLWFDEDDNTADGAYEGVIATTGGVEFTFGSVFSEGATITDGTDYVMAGTTSNNTLTATDGAYNVLFGYHGDDTLVGGTGTDCLIGGTGTDSFVGGDGDDTVSFIYDESGVQVILNGASAGSIVDGEGNTETVTTVENVVGSYYDDTLFGDSDANFLRGMAGDDSMVGGDGNDFLDGGLGQNTMTGGSGSDTFYIDAATQHGAILDFCSYSGYDRIALNPDGDFASIMPDGLDPSCFDVVEDSTYSGVNATIGTGAGLIYVSDTGSIQGELWYDPDVSSNDGDEVLLLEISEDMEGPADLDLDYDCFMSAGGGGGSP